MKAILRRVLISLGLLLLAAWTMYHWLYSPASGSASRVHFLYTKEASYALDYEGLAQELTSQGISSTVKETVGWETDAKRAIRDGIPILVIGIADAPWDSRLLSYAERMGTTLFFVGQYPGDDYLTGYQKAYYVGSHLEYAGELAGQELAHGFQDGRIFDRNGNQILEYLVASEHPEHSLFLHSLAECEHHGVYTQDSLTQIPADAILPQDDHGKAILPSHWTDCILPPEVILCGSFVDLQDASAWCTDKGWTDVAFVTFMRTAEEAAQASDLGCNSVILYDMKETGNTVSLMIWNLVHHQSMTQDLPFALDELGAVWLPYHLYSTTETNESGASQTVFDQNP